MHKDQSRKLGKLLEENSRKLNEVESNLFNQRQNTNRVESLFKCEECDEIFRNKQESSASPNLLNVTIVTKLSMKAGNMKHT